MEDSQVFLLLHKRVIWRGRKPIPDSKFFELLNPDAPENILKIEVDRSVNS